MGSDLADRFVGMYVNHWTLDYGERGRAAVNQLLREGAEGGHHPRTARKRDRFHRPGVDTGEAGDAAGFVKASTDRATKNFRTLLPSITCPAYPCDAYQTTLLHARILPHRPVHPRDLLTLHQARRVVGIEWLQPDRVVCRRRK